MIAGGLALAFFFIFIAGVLNEENADSLMAGYNTMSDERKKKVDFKAMTRLFKQTFYTMAIVIVVLSLTLFIVENEKIILVLIILTSCCGLSFFMLKGKQYDRNSYKKRETTLQYFTLFILITGGLLLSYFLLTTSE